MKTKKPYKWKYFTFGK